MARTWLCLFAVASLLPPWAGSGAAGRAGQEAGQQAGEGRKRGSRQGRAGSGAAGR